MYGLVFCCCTAPTIQTNHKIVHRLWNVHAVWQIKFTKPIFFLPGNQIQANMPPIVTVVISTAPLKCIQFIRWTITVYVLNSMHTCEMVGQILVGVFSCGYWAENGNIFCSLHGLPCFHNPHRDVNVENTLSSVYYIVASVVMRARLQSAQCQGHSFVVAKCYKYNRCDGWRLDEG